MIKTSVIIPTHNDDHRLKLILQGLFGQGLYPDEIVVVNDGGRDTNTTAQFVARSPLIGLTKYVYLEPEPIPEGAVAWTRVAKARNTGIRHSTGDFLLFLDGDCVPDPDWLAAHLKASENGTRYTFGLRRYLPQHLIPYNWPLRSADRMRNMAAPDERKPYEAPVPGFIYRWVYGHNFGIPAHMACAVGGFDESIQSWGSEDVDFAGRVQKRFSKPWMALWDHGKVTHLDHPSRRPASYSYTEKLDPVIRNGGVLGRIKIERTP